MKDRSMSTILGAIALAGMFVAPYFALIFASVEKEQKLAQKIFYFHVPCAWVSFMGFFIVFVASILYLWKKDRIFDIWASAAAEVGVLFCSLVLLTGPIWAKPIWNTWWVWDAKLTTTLVLWLIYVAYLMSLWISLRYSIFNFSLASDLWPLTFPFFTFHFPFPSAVLGFR